jgi:hypothetical protein
MNWINYAEFAGIVVVSDHGHQGLFSFLNLPITFPFLLCTAKLMCSFFNDKQCAANCPVRIPFSIYFVSIDRKAESSDRKAGITRRPERPKKPGKTIKLVAPLDIDGTK